MVVPGGDVVDAVERRLIERDRRPLWPDGSRMVTRAEQ
jgi:hypothetical protein